MPLPARQPILLEDEDPRRLGELFHAAMQAWDFVGDPPTGARLAERVTIHYGQRDPADQRRLIAWLSRCVERFADSELLPELRAARARNELFHEVEIDALERWRPRGEMQFLGRFGLWLATAGKPMWVANFG
jgi:ATP-dependent helicase/nuclease subunit A